MGKHTTKDLKMIWEWIDSLDKDSNEYIALEKTDSGKVMVSKIKMSDIPKSFKDKFLKRPAKNNFAIEELISITQFDQPELFVSESSKISRGFLQTYDILNWMKEGKSDTTILELICSKYKVGLVMARRLHRAARKVNELLFKDQSATLKSSLFTNYKALYELAVKNGNVKEARNILDSISKLTGANEPEKLQLDNIINIKFDE